jgi:hypothetical protein
MSKDTELLNKILNKVNLGDEPLKNSYVEPEADISEDKDNDISEDKDTNGRNRVRNDVENKYSAKENDTEYDKPFTERSIILENSKYNPNMADVEVAYKDNGMLAFHMLGEREQNYYVTCKNMNGADWTTADAIFTEDYIRDEFDKAHGLIDMINFLSPAITDYGESHLEDVKVTLNGLNDRGLSSLSSNLPRFTGSIDKLYTSEQHPNDKGEFQLRLNIDSIDKKTFPQMVINVEPNDVKGSEFSQKATLIYNPSDKGRFSELVDELGKMYEVVDPNSKDKDMERELDDVLEF